MRGAVGFGKSVDAMLIFMALLLVCMAMRIMNLAAKQVLAVLLTVIGAAISPCRPCLNRCGRRVFGKGYQMVDVYGPQLDSLDPEGERETDALPTNRDAEA